jgi:uncharacterized alkaline shock family protein YloU
MQEEITAVPGQITVEPEVLDTIARLTALEVPGVVDVAEKEVDRFLGITGKAVSVQVREGHVMVDLHLIAGPNVSLLQLGHNVQYAVTRAVQKMIGMPVDAVNVHIEDVIYPQAEAVEPS